MPGTTTMRVGRSIGRTRKNLTSSISESVCAHSLSQFGEQNKAHLESWAQACKAPARSSLGLRAAPILIVGVNCDSIFSQLLGTKWLAEDSFVRVQLKQASGNASASAPLARHSAPCQTKRPLDQVAKRKAGLRKAFYGARLGWGAECVR